MALELKDCKLADYTLEQLGIIDCSRGFGKLGSAKGYPDRWTFDHHSRVKELPECMQNQETLKITDDGVFVRGLYHEAFTLARLEVLTAD